MKNKKPPFEINEEMINDIIEIAELAGMASMNDIISSNPTLRRTNRIRTIHSSLAIEQNTLDIEQVTAILAGKHIIAPPKDIAEIKNAYEIYEHLDMLDPYDADDLLKAHGIMMRGLTDDAGQFRTRPAGVADSSGNIIHFGTLPQYVPGRVCELLGWVKTSDIHMLIKSCVFHYELELIHPFSNCNGRIGRLWHTLLLSQWKPMFAWLPIESIIHDNQAEYYDAVNISNNIGESTVFIRFMLSVIKQALKETLETHIKTYENKHDMRIKAIEKFFDTHDFIINNDVRNICGVSSPTATRLLNKLSKEGMLKRVRIGSHWGYIKVRSYIEK